MSRGLPLKNSNTVLCFLAAFFLVTEFLKQVLLYTHYAPAQCLWYFPFQLCSMPLYLLPVYARTKNRVLETFLVDFSLLGGIFVFFDQSGMHYELPILTVHSYLWHIMMIVTGIYLILRSDGERTWKEYLQAACLLLALAAAATVLNLLLHPYGEINMFYISPFYPVSQVVFRDIAKVIGDMPARLLYLSCLAVGGGMFHGAARLLRRLMGRAACSNER